MALPLVETEEEAPLTVSELVGLIQQTLESRYRDLLVLGEVTSHSAPASGHRYFTLVDEAAAIDCVMWRSDARRLTFDPEPGDEVVCRGRVSVYAKQGRMQLYVSAMKPVGAGAAQRALEELKRRLADEGLFDLERKRELPFLPRTIGVVTSPSGAAIEDILTTLARRFAGVHVVLAPAAVQGDQAAAEIVSALTDLAEYGGCDVVIVGRGGGAAEDLAAFNDEAVVRAVAAFPAPVVSAVGHEVDTSLSDLAADHRAATPTAAAEAVVPVYEELAEQVADLGRRLVSAARRRMSGERHRIGDVGGRLSDPGRRVADARQTVDRMEIRLERALTRRRASAADLLDELRGRLQMLARARVESTARSLEAAGVRLERAIRERGARAATGLAGLEAKLSALDPLSVLERGYSLVRRADGRLVRSSDDVADGDVVDLRFRSGRASAEIKTTDPAG